MNSVTIAITLFVILCPCVSYIIVRRRLTPWSGGIFFVMGDDSLIQVSWDKFESKIPTLSVIKVVFVAGARASMMPNITFRRFLRDSTASLTKEMVSYCQHETDNGVYQIYADPMDGTRFSFFLLDVYAPYPWKGWQRRSNSNDSEYYNYIKIDFRDDKSVVIK